MRIKGTVSFLEFDADGFQVATRAAIERQARRAVKRFVEKAVPLVPVQTGMAKGSFLNIGRVFKALVPISPTRTGQRYYPPGGGGSIPKIPLAGASLSTQPGDVLKWVGKVLTFTFQTKVFHFILEDLIGVHSGPWKAFTAGRTAFMAEMADLRGRLPSVGAFITKTTITFGTGGQAITSKRVRLRTQQTVR